MWVAPVPVDNVEKASDGVWAAGIGFRFSGSALSGPAGSGCVSFRSGGVGENRCSGIDTAAGFAGWFSAAVSVHGLVCFSGHVGGFFAFAFWCARADFLRQFSVFITRMLA